MRSRKGVSVDRYVHPRVEAEAETKKGAPSFLGRAELRRNFRLAP